MTHIPGPFRVKCLLCDTQVESWHRDFPAPEGATIGMDSRAAMSGRTAWALSDMAGSASMISK